MYNFTDLKDKTIFYAKNAPYWAWALLIVIVLYVALSASGGLGQWWENRKQKEFDRKEKEYISQIQSLNILKEEFRLQALAAQEKEKVYAEQVQAVRAEIEKSNKDLRAFEKKLDGISDKYEEDLKVIEDFQNGKIGAYDFCMFQCEKSAKVGYPCRPDYCSNFFKE